MVCREVEFLYAVVCQRGIGSYPHRLARVETNAFRSLGLRNPRVSYIFPSKLGWQCIDGVQFDGSNRGNVKKNVAEIQLDR